MHLVYTDYAWRIGCGGVIRQLSNRLQRFTAIVSHIGGRDEFLPSLSFFLRHFVSQCISRLYGTVVKGLNTCTCMLHIDSLIRQ